MNRLSCSVSAGERDPGCPTPPYGLHSTDAFPVSQVSVRVLVSSVPLLSRAGEGNHCLTLVLYMFSVSQRMGVACLNGAGGL
ncbi:hypothetical protein COCON_G00173430 [Conger conger]|uniref:Uncharacterized protein n=1 Tax=Conger conger TaxID=82655 RepID=A0A9Q1D457_CONCO|nr:hypothetical protein COCON_G00173430 [Conger conger]